MNETLAEMDKKPEYKDYTPYWFKGVRCEGLLSPRKFEEGERVSCYPVFEIPFICRGEHLIAQPDERVSFLLEIAKQIKEYRDLGLHLDWIKNLKGHIPYDASFEKDDDAIKKYIKREYKKGEENG